MSSLRGHPSMSASLAVSRMTQGQRSNHPLQGTTSNCLPLTKVSASILTEIRLLESIQICLSHAPEFCRWHAKPACSPPPPSELRSSTQPRRPPRTLIVRCLMPPSRASRRLVCLPSFPPFLIYPCPSRLTVPLNLMLEIALACRRQKL